MLGMTEWDAQTPRITGKDIAEKNDLKSNKQAIDKDCNKTNGTDRQTDKDSNKTNGVHTIMTDRQTESLSMDQSEGLHSNDQSSQKSRRPPPPRELYRTDSNLTLDSDLSSEAHNSPIAWQLTSGVGKDQEYIMSQKLIEVEACNKVTRRSGIANYTLGLSDIKESSFDFDEIPRSTPPPTSPVNFDFDKIPRSRPAKSPNSPITRSNSVGTLKEVSKKIHSQLKRSMSTQGTEKGTYAARRKALTRSIQEWVNSIDRSPHPEEDDNEALSFLPVRQLSKEDSITEATNMGVTTNTGVASKAGAAPTGAAPIAVPAPSLGSKDFDVKQVVPKKQLSIRQQRVSSEHKTETGQSDSYGEVKAPSRKHISRQVGNYSRKPVDKPSHADLIMMASHYRQEHCQSPISRHQRLLHMGVSQSSDMSACSNRSQNSSVGEILMHRDDPEQFLLDLGFGSKEQEIIDRVPTRFYTKPSKARGMNVGQFLTNCHEQEIRSYDDLNIGGGFRSIVGILQRSREGQARELKMAQKIRKRSVVNAWNMWLNKTVRVNTGDKDKDQIKELDSDNVTEKPGGKVDIQDDINNCSKNQTGEVVEEVITSSSVTAVDQAPESMVKQEAFAANNGDAVIEPGKGKVSAFMEEQPISKVEQHWKLPHLPVREDSDGSIASKKSSSSTLEGDSSGSTLRIGNKSSSDKSEETNLSDTSKDLHPLVVDHRLDNHTSKDLHPLVVDHRVDNHTSKDLHPLVVDHRVDNPAEIYSFKDTKDYLRRIPGHLLSNTPQESFEFEEVSTASEMMEDERQSLERLSAMKGQLSRTGSAQSDSSGFADDLVETTGVSILPSQLDVSDDDVICVHDKDVQTNSNEFLYKEEHNTDHIVDSDRYDSFEEDSPFDDSYQETTPQKRTRLDTFPRPSERVPWSADHPRSVIEILKTLKDNSGIQSRPKGHSNRPPLLKLKSVYADYPDELPTTTNLSATQLPSIGATDRLSNSPKLPSIHSTQQTNNLQKPSIDSTVQSTNSQLPSIDLNVKKHDSCLPYINSTVLPTSSSHLPSIDSTLTPSNSDFMPSIDTSVQLYSSPLPSTLSKSNILPLNAQLDNGNLAVDSITLCKRDSIGTVTPITSTDEHYANIQTSLTDTCRDLQEMSPTVTSNFEVYLTKDYRGLSTVTPRQEIPNQESTSPDGEHDKVCCDLNDLIGSVKSCDIRLPMNEMEISNTKQQMALQDILLLHRAISGYKSELVELEGLSDQLYQMVHSQLTLSERYELGSLRTLRLQVMEEVESIERLLVSLADTISNEHQVEDFPGSYRNALDHLQVLKQMITLLQEQKMLRDTLGSLEVEYQIAYGRVVQEHPMPWTSERAQLIEQLMDLKAELDRQRQSSQKQFASSLQEMKHDLLEQLRNDVMEETKNLRSQLKLKETEIEKVRRQLRTNCDGNSNQSKISSHVT